MKTGNGGEAAGTQHAGDSPCRALREKEKTHLCNEMCSSEGLSACGVSVQRSAAQPAPRGADTQGQPLGVRGDAGLDVLQAGQVENTATATAPLGHRQVRKGQKALPCHPDK